MQPRRVLLLATSLVLAASIWVSRGALGVADPGAWPERLGILPSRWAPPVLVLVFLLALRRAGRSTLLALLVPGVLMLPWLPIPVPAAALIWTNHVVEWAWAATGLALLAVAWPRVSPSRLARLLGDPRRGSLAALLLAFALYCTAAWLVSPVLPGGDEPHYLVITQSLLQDSDLQIENNHERGDYRAYFAGALKPDFLRRGKNGQIYSIHAPGLPALVAPAFFTAGYRGVIAFLALVSALGTWLVWRAGYRLTGSAGAAWFGWATAAVPVPFFVHAFMVYPDATGATCVMAGVLGLLALEGKGLHGAASAAAWGTGRWIAVGGALAALPWLHTRYAGAAVLLGAFTAIRLASQRSFLLLAAFAALPVVSAAGWFGHFYAVYGEFSPAAPYGHYTQSALENIPRGFPALLFDQQFGALLNGPAYAVGLVGLVSLFRLRRRLGVEIGLLVLSYLLLVSVYYMWWGGWSAPARFAVPVLLALGVPAAAFWSRQRAAGRAIGLAALGVTGLLTASMTIVNDGRLIFNHRDGFAAWLEWLTPVVDLPRALPSFLRDGTGTALAHTAIWVLAVAITALALRALARRYEGDAEAGRARLAVATLLACAVCVTVAAGATWRASRVAGPTPSTAALSLLRAYDPAARPVGVQFLPFRRLPIEQVPPRLPLPVSNRRPIEADSPLLVLFDVPPGTYRLAPATALAAQGRAVVTIGRSTQPIARWIFDRAPGEGNFSFTLPVGANAVVVAGDQAARRSMSRIALEPVAVAPEVSRFAVPRAARAAQYDEVTAFAFEPDAYVEDNGIWVPGGSPTTMAFTGAAGASTVRLLLRNCPVENQVTLRGRSGTEVFAMKPGEIRVVELPVDRTNGGALVEVTAARGYRPAEVDPNTQDRRYLGVWIQNAPR